MHDEILRLAMEIDQFAQDYDPYEYGDAIDDSQQALQELAEDIASGNVTYLIDYYQDILQEFSPEELAPGDYERVQEILKKLEKFVPDVARQKSIDTLMQDAKQRTSEKPDRSNDVKRQER